MDLTNINDLKSLLGKFRIKPSDRLGQNFLVDRAALESIVTAAELADGDRALEIGAGAGTLTVELAKRCAKVVAIEKDRKLIKPLEVVLRLFENVRVVEGDALRIDIGELMGEGDYKVVANIPYNITGEIIEKLLSQEHKPRLIVMLVQKEVAERITARPGQLSVLAVSVQLYGTPEIIGAVPAASFYPAPEVDSAILKIRVFGKPKVHRVEQEFFRVVKVGFSSKRKTLVNNLAAGLHTDKKTAAEHLAAAGIGEKARAQELSVEQWGDLCESVKRKMKSEK